jgi:hypothetical protein
MKGRTLDMKIPANSSAVLLPKLAGIYIKLLL